ncbi:polysaccharide pyruvyl transferase family protein [Enterococcus faecalis]|uniref:polysaccharide pyruvyl transferase family protein n=1 Tax=Enterococcus faecalis TaxID=1351 RepID=UPI002090A121|nr:polysaccharide pyruvyl transferase family protein [Enterococcus faecalis]MCO5432959.1 polysaccharide pyruvyl transferase family protein [Enterococcus faecalis]
MDRKVVMVSFIDSSNIGDQLISKTIEQELLIDYEVENFSYKYVEDDFYCNSINKKRRSWLNKVYNKYIKNIMVVHTIIAKTKWFLYYNYKLKRQDSEKLRKALRETGVLIIGGGNVIFDSSRHTFSALKFAHLLDIAEEEGAEVFVCSIGIGPFQTEKQEKEAVKQLKRCKAVVLRDSLSQRYCIENDFETAVKSIDPVFLLKAEDKAMVKKTPIIGICVIDYRISGASYEKYVSYLKNLKRLITILDRYLSVKIVLFSTEKEDYNTIDELEKGLPDVISVSSRTVDSDKDLLKMYSTFDLVIGTRMHSMIIAVSQNIPVIGLSWQQKVDEMFKNINLTNSCYDIENLEYHLDEILEKSKNIIENNQSYVNEMKVIKNKLANEFLIVRKELEYFMR